VKTQIVRLESHDDATSVKDKMGWGQTSRILLVWPRQGQILNRRLDLVYLKRHSNSLGARLAFVTNDSKIRFYAEHLGIPIYPNIRKAEESHWRTQRRKKKSKVHQKKSYSSLKPIVQDQKERPNLKELRELAYPKTPPWLIHPITRVILFCFGVLGVLSIAAVLLPSAEIKISPKNQWQTITIPASAVPNIDEVDLSGQVPIHAISIKVEGRGQIPTSGTLSLPDEKARGKVIFSNLTDREIEIPIGTVISTIGEDSIRFTTLELSSVIPDSESTPIPIEAVLPGSGGNLKSKTLIAVEGPLGLVLTVINPNRTYGGSDLTLPAPGDQDYQNLMDDMLENLYTAAIEELTMMLEPGDLVLKPDPTDYTIIQDIFTPAEIQPADELFLTMQVEFFAQIASGEDTRELGQSVLTANLPSSFLPDLSSLEIQYMDQPTINSNQAYNWEIQAGWEIVASLDEIEAVTLILWQKPEDAVDLLLESLPIEKPVVIEMTPKWWPRLPILPFRLSITSLN
jgi:hypothetical protein